MSFYLSKIFWVLIQPSNLLLLTMLLAAVTIRFWPRVGRRLLWTSAAILLVNTFVPLGQWLMAPIEQRFPERTEFPENVDGIIVLGGGVDVGPSIGRGHLELNGGAERLTVSAELARDYPTAKLVYSGIRGRLVEESVEVPDIFRFYQRRGIGPERVVLEGDSRNTFENAVFSRELVEPADDEVWLLVTSAWHMPRAVGIFRKIGWSVLPVPVDFRRAREPDVRSQLTLVAQPHVSNRLVDLDHAAKAWVGLIAYWLMGRTSALLPGPE
jgi:uncharacterized SAM-binding protein YcdF (DUF218 family)